MSDWHEPNTEFTDDTPFPHGVSTRIAMAEHGGNRYPDKVWATYEPECGGTTVTREEYLKGERP